MSPRPARLTQSSQQLFASVLLLGPRTFLPYVVLRHKRDFLSAVLDDAFPLLLLRRLFHFLYRPRLCQEYLLFFRDGVPAVVGDEVRREVKVVVGLASPRLLRKSPPEFYIALFKTAGLRDSFERGVLAMILKKKPRSLALSAPIHTPTFGAVKPYRRGGGDMSSHTSSQMS